MKNRNLFAAGGIILVTVTLLAVNHFTNDSFVKDYALLLIIAGMFLGIAIGRIGKRK